MGLNIDPCGTCTSTRPVSCRLKRFRMTEQARVLDEAFVASHASPHMANAPAECSLLTDYQEAVACTSASGAPAAAMPINSALTLLSRIDPIATRLQSQFSDQILTRQR